MLNYQRLTSNSSKIRPNPSKSNRKITGKPHPLDPIFSGLAFERGPEAIGLASPRRPGYPVVWPNIVSNMEKATEKPTWFIHVPQIVEPQGAEEDIPFSDLAAWQRPARSGCGNAAATKMVLYLRCRGRPWLRYISLPDLGDLRMRERQQWWLSNHLNMIRLEVRDLLMSGHIGIYLEGNHFISFSKALVPNFWFRKWGL